MNSVPITGIGVIAPGAIGVDSFRELLARGESAVADVDRFDTSAMRSHRAALVRGFAPRDFIPMMKMRRMNTLSRLLVAASRLAIDDAQVTLPQETGVAVGTAFGPVQTSVDYMQEYIDKGPSLAPPQIFAESVANAPGSHAAIEWGLRGFNITVTQRESSALAAAMHASSQLMKGAVQAALIGGVDEANELLYSVLDRLGALAHPSGDADEASRPFDTRHNGFVLGEGSAVLVAGAGQRTPYAWLSGFGMARDISATVSDWGTSAESVADAMRAAIEDAEIPIESIDAVYASANSSPRADAVEAKAIAALFGIRTPVVAPKGVFGEYAAGGALQLVAAILAVATQTLHASVGFERPAGGSEIAVNRSSRSAQLRHVLVNSVSAGGGIVSAVVSKEAV